MRTAVELFTGLGGLALGLERAGFGHLALVEWDRQACETVRLNHPNWPLHEADVREFDFDSLPKGIDLLAGGPPCQPFSVGGKHQGHADGRNMFPEVFRAQRCLQPKFLLLENVYGLVRTTFRPYFEYILLQLRFPFVVAEGGESWEEHKARLLRVTGQSERELSQSYDITYKVINAADYGVPQIRRRVIIVGVRRDLGVSFPWSAVPPTHSREALLYAKLVSGSYWDEHALPSPPPRPGGNNLRQPTLERWRTIRDAIRDLPEPINGSEAVGFVNHVGIPGARVYQGHTGNPLDEPSKTVKAGDHGCPGGEHVLIKDNGEIRYLTVRESARLQGFPDDIRFTCSRTEAMRQLGNAVPVPVAEAFARVIYGILDSRISAPRESRLEQVALL